MLCGSVVPVSKLARTVWDAVGSTEKEVWSSIRPSGSTLHAASPAGAMARLLEMGVEPYQLSSAIFGIVSQRLLRRLGGSKYQGRIPVAEFVMMDDALRRAILARSDAATLEKIYAQQPGYRPMRTAAGDGIQGGLTDEAEVRRVLGEPAPAAG